MAKSLSKECVPNQHFPYERELKEIRELHKGMETTADWVQGVISDGGCISAQFIQNSYSRGALFLCSFPLASGLTFVCFFLPHFTEFTSFSVEHSDF